MWCGGEVSVARCTAWWTAALQIDFTERRRTSFNGFFSVWVGLKGRGLDGVEGKRVGPNLDVDRISTEVAKLWLLLSASSAGRIPRRDADRVIISEGYQKQQRGVVGLLLCSAKIFNQIILFDPFKTNSTVVTFKAFFLPVLLKKWHKIKKDILFFELF